MNKKQLIVALVMGVSFIHINISLAQPNIEVKGIITGKNPSAIVNGRMVEVGDVIGDIKIVGIKESLIEYEYDNQIHTKRLGEGIIKKDMSRKKVDSDSFSILKFSVVDFRWNWESYSDMCLFSPQLRIKFTNTSNQPLNSLMVAKVIFIDKTKKEIFGEVFEDEITSSSVPLKPKYSKILYFSPDIGYKHCLIRESYPTIVAEVYVNNEFYTKIKMPSKKWHHFCLSGSCE